jgi:hypothetical protein
MNEELRKVLHGFNQLALGDKEKFRERTKDQTFEGGSLNERVEKSDQITMGPLGDGCPCCGRGYANRNSRCPQIRSGPSVSA